MAERKDQEKKESAGQDAKAERLRAALRANLNKRKAQKRARVAKPDKEESR